MSNWSNLYEYKEDNVKEYAPTAGGVYRLSYEKEKKKYIFYVGQSNNLQRRLLEHLSDSEPDDCIKGYLGKYTCYFRFIEVKDEEERSKLEQEQIEEYNPDCNNKN